MSKEAVLTMKLEPKLRAEFMAEATGEVRPASPLIREYDDYLRRKIEAGRASMRAGHGRSNDELETASAAKRSRIVAGQT